jgi:hypothetical protein
MGSTGNNGYFIDESNVIRFATAAAANAASQAIGN